MSCKVCGQKGVNSRTCLGIGKGHWQRGGKPLGSKVLNIKLQYYNEDGFITVDNTNINDIVRATEDALKEFQATVSVTESNSPYIHNMQIIYTDNIGDEGVENYIVGLLNNVHIGDDYSLSVYFVW